MKTLNVILALATVMILVGMLAKKQWSAIDSISLRDTSESPPVVKSIEGSALGGKISAAGWIEGRTSNIEIRSRISEQIQYIPVNEGDWVEQGDVLLRFDSSLHQLKKELAEAELNRKEADLLYVRNGFRDTEIEEARHEFAALVAEAEGARKILARLERLTQSMAASQQEYDEQYTRVMTLDKRVDAAHSRLSTMEAPPREDELNRALAGVESARAQLSLANEELKRTTVSAPSSGRVLRVNCEVGELAQPDQMEPLIVLADSRQLRAVVEVDEFDALQVELGQPAIISLDYMDGVLARGTVVEIEPQMSRKRLYTDRLGENLDSFSRRVWIALVTPVDEIPIGLPVSVLIAVETKPKAHSGETSLEARQAGGWLY